MKITVKGNFKHLKEPDNILDIDIDMNELHNSDKTLSEVITEAFEDLNTNGCTCNYNESQNHCDCDGYGYGYGYEILEIEDIKNYTRQLNENFSYLLKELQKGKQFIVTLYDNKKYKRVAVIKQYKNGDIDVASLGVSYIYFVKDLDNKDTIIKALRDMRIKIIEEF